MGNLSVADRIAGALPQIYGIVPLEMFPTRVLPLLLAMVGGDKCGFHAVDVATGDYRVRVLPSPEVLDELHEARVAYMRQHPVLAHFARVDCPDARMISDFLTTVEYHRLPLYGEFFRHLGVEDQIIVGISPSSSGTLAGISIERGHPGFTSDDRRLMDAMQPHLAAAHRNAVHFSRAIRNVDPGTVDSAGKLDRLTSRQVEILQCLAAGRSNAQIAATLDLSQGTVRKHLEHILRRLEVTTRTAAAVAYVAGSRQQKDDEWSAYVPSFVTVSH